MIGHKVRMRNSLRIIAGAYRGRRLHFPDSPGLRPTGDRMRETLFNWLQPMIVGAHVLDLFAGSGALGFEAASRGASRVLLIDNELLVYAALQDNAVRLDPKGEQVQLLCDDTFHWLGKAPKDRFDLVLIDPPFQERLAQSTIEALHRSHCLASNALIYLETSYDEGDPVLPDGWTVHRDKLAGQVRYRLIKT